MKRLQRRTIIAGALVLSLIGWTWFVRDVPLSAAAKSLLESPSNVPVEQNGEYVLWGLPAPVELAARDAGITYAEWLGQRVREGDADVVLSDETPWQKKAMVLELGALKMPDCSWRSGNECLSQLSWEIADTNSLLAGNRVLIGRYHELKQYQHFHRVLPARLDNPLPPYLLAMRTSQLIQFSAATVLLRSSSMPERQQALVTIREEMAFWRKRLSGDNSLISKFIALAAVRDGAKLINELASVIDDKHGLEALLMAVPLMTESERSMVPAFTDEGMLQVSTAIRQIPGEDSSLKSQAYMFLLSAAGLYQANHTANLLAENIQRMIAISSLPANQLLERRGDVFERCNAQSSEGCSSWHYYNAIGRTLVEIGQSLLLDYAFRAHDCDGFIRLVNLKIRYLLRSDKAQSVPAFVSQADASLQDPYSGNTMRWNEESAELGFTGYADPARHGFGEHWLAVTF